VVSAVQIGLALTQLVLIWATPFVVFAYNGYGSFGINYQDNGLTLLLTLFIAVGVTGIGYAGWMSGWGATSEKARRYARLTLWLAAWEWLLTFWVVLDMWSRIDYYANSASQGDQWWVGTAFYALTVGATLFTILGAVGVTRPWAAERVGASSSWPAPPPPAPPYQTQPPPPPPAPIPGPPGPPPPAPGQEPWQPDHRVPDGGMLAWASPDPSLPIAAKLAAGLDVKVLHTTGTWAQVACSNGWRCWVDKRLLISTL
jgi:hypothetical protein